MLKTIEKLALEKKNLTYTQAEYILNFPDDDILLLLHSAYKVRKKFVGKKVDIHILKNAKSGLCAQDCHYCAQSRISKAKINEYALQPKEILFENAKIAKDNGADYFCMALSNIKYPDKTIEELADSIRNIKEKLNINTCCSIGFLSKKQIILLKKAGLNRINHNLNSSKTFYPKICTTHSYDARVENIKRIKDSGMEVCSGGIVGLGENKKDVISMLFALRETSPQSVPINFLIPVKGTPLEKKNELNPLYCLKVLCLARFLLADKQIRVAGGREVNLRSLQPLSLYPANSMFVSGYLTTEGQNADKGLNMVKDMGFA